MPTPSDLKKSLIAQGFEIYRTSPDQVSLADRVRDNLLMDSGVAVRFPELGVRIMMRVQQSDFPDEGADELYAKAVSLATSAEAKGYREITRNSTPVRDPGDRSKTLDTWFEVVFERRLNDEAELTDELRFALSLEKTVLRR